LKNIYIIHENNEWVTPLKVSFAKLGIEAKEWFINQGEINFDTLPPDGIFYNRMSASSHTRGHRFAPELTHVALNWLETYNRTVINGSHALYLELSKIAQYAALQQAGIKTPNTVAVVGEENILTCAANFGFPLILKPNRGGKGLGVQLFKDKNSLKTFLESSTLETPLDGIWLIQQYIQSEQPFITRCEFVGGKFLYAVKVATEGGFELCPADVCQIGDTFCPVGEAEPSEKNNIFSITHDLDNDPIIAKAEQFLKNNHVDIAGIEVIKDKKGQLYAYDVNTNTNYNALAEQTAAVPTTGMNAIAQYLAKLACK